MARIGRGEDYILTNADAWRIRTLQESGELLEDILAELSRYTKREQQELLEAFEDAGITALDYDDKIYKAAGLSPVPLEQSPAMIRLMERNMLATMGEWKNFTRTTASAAQALYINQCDLAYNHVMTGAVGYTQAIREAVNNVVSNGVTVTYPSGRKIQLKQRLHALSELAWLRLLEIYIPKTHGRNELGFSSGQCSHGSQNR